MPKPTAYVEIERITDDRTEGVFHAGYAWDTDALTVQAYNEAKRRFEVPFEHADYLIDLYSKPAEMVDTFPIAELGYRTLIKAR